MSDTAKGGSPLDADPAFTFTLEAYKAMRAEVIAQGAKYDQLKIWLLAGLGAYYGWIFSNVFGVSGGEPCSKLPSDITVWLLIIPIAIAAMSTISAGFLAAYFSKVGRFFWKVETRLSLPGLSWQEMYCGNPTPSERWPGLQALGDIFWPLLLVALTIFSLVVFGTTHHLRLCEDPKTIVVQPAKTAAPSSLPTR